MKAFSPESHNIHGEVHMVKDYLHYLMTSKQGRSTVDLHNLMRSHQGRGVVHLHNLMTSLQTLLDLNNLMVDQM